MVHPLRIPVVVASLLAAAACASDGRTAPPRPASCDLSQVAVGPVSPFPVAVGDLPVVARVSLGGGMMEGGPVDRLVVHPDGRLFARGDGSMGQPRSRYASIDGEGLTRLQQCIDDSRFVDVPEGSHTPAIGRSGERFCAVADASTTTVTARTSSGVVRTASAEALSLPDQFRPSSGCDFDRPEALTVLHDALDELRQRVADPDGP